MRRLINTFRYGSWKVRAFFGVIALALLGGAATIAVAAIAGLGIIPIAVGGAAMVLGIGMSTMATVVSDDKDKNGEQENTAGQAESDTGAAKGSDKVYDTYTAKGDNSESRETAGNGDIEAVTEAGNVVDDASEGNKQTGNKSASSEQTGNKSAASEQTGGIETIIAADDGSYVPDIIVEKFPEKAERRLEPEENNNKTAPVNNRADFADDKSETTNAARSGEDGAAQKTGLAARIEKIVSMNEEAAKELENERLQREESERAKRRAKAEEEAKRAEELKLEEAARTAEERAEVNAKAEAAIKQKEEDYSDRLKEEQIQAKAEEKLENRQNREAIRDHIREGRTAKTERRAENRALNREIKRKTGEYGEELEEKFENEMSFAEKEKLRLDNYEKGIKEKLKVREQEEKKRKRDEKAEKDAEEDTAEGGFFKRGLKRIGNIFNRLFANVHDEPEDNLSERDLKDAKTEKDKTSDKPSDKARKKQTDKTDRTDTKKKDKTEKTEKKKQRKDKKKKGTTVEADSETKAGNDRTGSRSESRSDRETVPEPVRERMPGDEIDVTRYTAGNMKKIIKANKIGKDFVPVFIDSWKSQRIEKTPALCFVKDDRVHFLLLEGDMERNVSISMDNFSNVWYKRNVPETNTRIYQNMKENMGAYDMFESVIPNIAFNTDQMGKTDYTRNLYLLGNDIAVAPPSMRELRKRFRFNTNIFDSLNTKGNYSDDFKKAYENRILWTDNVITMQEYQRRIRAILQEMVNSEELTRYEFEEDVAKMVQYRLITDEYAEFYLKLRRDKK